VRCGLGNSPLAKAVRGRFLNVFGLEAHDNWI
jgi:hypothetical protein